MSETIEKKIVEMRFDNAQFEKNVQKTIDSTQRLKDSLKFDNRVSDAFGKISKAAKNVDLETLADSVDHLNKRFSALGVVGMTVMQDITRAVEKGVHSIVANLTTIPMKSGLQEYETQIESTQTIMANTGRSVQDVNAALDELNEYADLTIYNFSQMTSNIGKFTSAIGKTPGGLEKATAALKGIGNWAAYAGANATQMATATYQLSQAMSNGVVKLMDWNSVVNASMGGMNFQEAFKETARELGIGVDAAIAKWGSFRDSLQEGWFTADVFYETMAKFANDPAMTDAATKVKTFTQMIGVLKEALGTGWAQTWRNVIGDYEEAKTFFTSLTTAIQDLIDTSSKARNEIVGEWMSGKVDIEKLSNGYAHGLVDFWGGDNGRKDLIQSIQNLMNAFASLVGPAKEAWEAVFEPITSKTLKTLSQRLEDITKKLILNIEQQKAIKRIFVGVFSALKVGTLVLRNVWTILSAIVNALEPAISLGLWGVSVIATAVEAISDLIIKMDVVTWMVNKITSFITSLTEAVGSLVSEFMSNDIVFNVIYKSLGLVAAGFEGIVKVIDKFKSFKDMPLESILDYIKNFDIKSLFSISGILGIFSEEITAVKNKLSEFKATVTEFFAPAFKIFVELFNKVKSLAIDFDIGEFFTNLKDKILKLLPILGLLGTSTGVILYAGREILYTFSGFGKLLAKTGRGIERYLTGYAIKELGEALQEMALALLMVAGAMFIIAKIPDEAFKRTAVTIVAIAGGLALIATALLILNAKLQDTNDKITEITSWKKALVTGFGELADSIKFLGIAAQIVALSIAMLALTHSLKVMADVFTIYDNLDIKNLSASILRIVAACAVLVGSMAVIGLAAKGTHFIGLATSILAMVLALKLLISVLQSYNTLNQDVFDKGFNNLSDTLITFAASLALIGLSVKRSAVGLLAMIPVMASVLVSLFSLYGLILMYGDSTKTDQIMNGIKVIGGILLGLTGLMALMSLVLGDSIAAANIGNTKNGKRSSIAGALLAFGAALTEIAIAMGLLIPVILVVSKIDTAGVLKTIGLLGSLIVALGVSSAMLAKTDWKVLLSFGFILLSFVGSLVTLSGLLLTVDLKSVLIAAGLLDGLMITMGIMLKRAKKFKSQATSLLALGAIFISLAAIISKFANMDAEGLYNSVGAISIIIGALAVLFKMATGLSNNYDKKNKTGSGSAFVGIIAMFTGLTALMVVITNAASTNLNQITLWSLVAVLGVIEVLIAALFRALEGINYMQQPKEKMIILGELFTGLAGLLWLISNAAQKSPSTRAILAMAATVGAIALSMDSILVVMNHAKEAGKNMIPVAVVAGILGILSMIVGGLAEIPNVDNLPKVSISIGIIATILSGMVAVCGILGKFVNAGAAIEGALMFVGVSSILVVGLIAVIGIIELMDELTGVWDTVKSFAKNLGETLGEFAGSLTSSAKALDPTIAQGLTDFMDSASGFFDSLKDINNDTVQGALSMSKALLALGGARLITSLGNLIGFFTGGNSLETIGIELDKFTPHFVKFANSIEGANLLKVQASGKAIAALFRGLTEAPNEGGLVSVFSGDNYDLVTMGYNLERFGDHLSIYAQKISSISDWKLFDESSRSVTRLFKALKEAPNEGGLVSCLTGDNYALASIGYQLEQFGNHLSVYATWVSQVQDWKSVNESARSTKNIFKSLSEAPNEGGLLGLFVGNNDNLSSIGQNLANFGKHLAEYAGYISKIDNWETIDSSADTMITLFNALKNAPEIKTKFMTGTLTSTTNIGAAGDALIEFAGKIAKFTDKLNSGKFKVTDWSFLSDVANGAADMMKLLRLINFKDFIKGFPKAGDLDKIGDSLYAFATMMNRFAKTIARKGVDYDSVIAILEKTKTIFELLTGLNFGSISNIETISDQMLQFGKNIREFYRTLDDVTVDSIDHAKELMLQYKKFTSMDTSKITADSISTSKNQNGSSSGGGTNPKSNELHSIYYSPTPGNGLSMLRKHYNEETNKTVRAIYKDSKKVSDELEEGTEEVTEETEKTEGILSKIFGKEKSDKITGKTSSIFGSVADKIGISEENQNTIREKFKSLNTTLNEDYGEFFDLFNADSAIQKVDEMFDGVMQSFAGGSEELEEEVNKTVDEVQEAFDNYWSSLKSKRDNFMNDGGLFSAVNWGFDPENPVTKETLKKNLEDQIAQLARFQNVQAELAGRITNTGLRDAIQSMGVDQLEELEALSTMTADELSAYEQLYISKMDKAMQTADTVMQKDRDELAGKLNATLGTSFNNLDSNDAVSQLESFWDGTEAGLQALIEADAAGIGHALSKSLAEGMMDEESMQVYRDTLGKGVSEGIAAGMTCDEAIQTLKDAGYVVSADTEKYLREAFDINSPSKLIRDNVGQYVLDAILPTDELAYMSIRDAAISITSWMLNAFKEQMLAYQAIGEMMDIGIAQGISSGVYNIQDAISNMGTLISSASKSLDSTEITPTIRPVYTSKALDEYNSMMNSLNAQRSSLLANQANASMETTVNKTIKVDNTSIVAAINKLDADMLSVSERVGNLQVMLDSGALVGQIAPQMNSALGMTALRTARVGG